jgi:hypothetical protein
MKMEFKNINDKVIAEKSVFYLYGNYKKSFDVFCRFLAEKLKKKSPEVDVFFVSVADCLEIVRAQCDLFGLKTNCFCIRNVEDQHWEKISTAFNLDKNIFVLESGDYGKSKKITDHFLKDSEMCAVASFKNDLTFHSLCRMLLPDVGREAAGEIVKIMSVTDEPLTSLFTKISLLFEYPVDPEGYSGLYGNLQRTFLQDLDVIPLVRYLSQTAIRQKIYQKLQSKLNLGKKGILETLLKIELKQKLNGNVSKSHIYQEMI